LVVRFPALPNGALVYELTHRLSTHL
jgi:hypothetical protein